jgi:hypothetical protein
MSAQLDRIKKLADIAEKSSTMELRKHVQALIREMIRWMELQEGK